MARRPGRGGFTLIELMVVVAIVGVLLTIAVVMIGRGASADRASNMVANRVREGARMAISGGVVDTNAVDDSGGAFGPKPARARLQITYDATNNIQLLNLDVRDETQGANAEWRVVSTNGLPGKASIEGFATTLEINPTGGSPPNALRGPHAPGATPQTVELFFFPDGSATDGAGNPITFFISSMGAQRDERRVAILPLQGRPLVFRGY